MSLLDTNINIVTIKPTNCYHAVAYINGHQHKPVARGWGRWSPSPSPDLGPHQHYWPHHQFLFMILGFLTLKFVRFGTKSHKITRIFSKSRFFRKIAMCIHHEFSSNGFIVSDIFLYRAALPNLVPTSNFLAMPWACTSKQLFVISVLFNININHFILKTKQWWNMCYRIRYRGSKKKIHGNIEKNIK